MSDAVIIAIVSGGFAILGKVVDVLLTRARAEPPKRRRRADAVNPFTMGGILNPATIGFLVLGIVVGFVIVNATGQNPFGQGTKTPSPTPPDTDQTAVPSAQVTEVTPDPGGLVQGGKALIHTTGGDRLRVREEPDFNGKVAFQLTDGVLVQLIEGPRQVGADNWWMIQTPDGRTGWVVEQVEGVQTLIAITP